MLKGAFAVGISALATLVIANLAGTISAGAGLAVCLALALAVIVLFRASFKRAKIMIWAIGAAILCLVWFCLYQAFFFLPDMKVRESEISLTGTICEMPAFTGEKYRYVLRADEAVLADGRRLNLHGKILLYVPEKLAADAYDQVALTGTLHVHNAANSGEYALYFKSRGQYFSMYPQSADEMMVIPNDDVLKAPYYYAIRLREKILERIDAYLPGDSGALAKALIAGERSGLTDEADNAFSRTGLTHLLAVSGMQTSLIAGAVFTLFLLFGFSRKKAAVCAMLGLVCFMGIVGFSGSVLRAGLMGLILYASIALGKQAESLDCLGAAALLMVLINPFSAVDLSFLLSLAAAIGMMVLAAPLTAFFTSRVKLKPAWLKKLLHAILAIFAQTIAASLFSYPVIALSFGDISLISPLANILVVGFANLTMAVDFFAALFGGVPVLAEIFGFAAKALSGYILTIIQTLAGVPYASVHIADRLLIIIMLLFFLCIFAAMRVYRNRGASRLTAGLACALFLTGCVATHVVLYKNVLTAAFVDVGQGACSVLSKDSRAVVIDCGGSRDAYGELSAYLRQENVQTVEYLVLSHYDADHVNGVIDLLYGEKVKTIMLPNYLDEERMRDQLCAAAKENGVQIQIVGADTSVEVWPGIQMSILTAHQRDGGEENEKSNAVYIEYGDSQLFFPGDIGFASEQILLAAYEDFEADVLAVAHHGSAYSTSERLLDTLAPAYAVISVGTNPYGHPDRDTLARIEAEGARIYTTKELGTVRFLTRGGGDFAVIAENREGS